MKNNGNGTSTWQDTSAGKQVLAKFSEEKTLHAIERLLSRLDSLEEGVMKLTALAEQGPGLVAMTADIMDEGYKSAKEKGINLEERINSVLLLTERLSNPVMVKKLNSLITLVDQFPGIIAMTADSTDELYRDANERGVNIDERIKIALSLAEKFTDPNLNEKIDKLLVLGEQLPGIISMVFDSWDEYMRTAFEKGYDPSALETIARASNTALTQSVREEPVKVRGIFGMLKALKDPDRQKGIGFILNFMKHFGRNIKISNNYRKQ